MTKILNIKCPFCNQNFELAVDENIVESASFYPVVFSTTHCNQALICYVDKSYTIRMIETAFLPSNNGNSSKSSPSDPSNLGENLNVDGQELIEQLSEEQRTVLECLISKEQFQTYKFPNLVEKQIFFQILKHGNLSLELLLQELEIIQKALNIEISEPIIEPIIEKYVSAGLLKKIKI